MQHSRVMWGIGGMLVLMVCASVQAQAPDPIARRLDEGAAYLEAGDWREARRVYREALEADPASVDAQIGLARVAIERRRWNEAGQLLDEVLAREPDHLDARLYRAITHREVAKFNTFTSAQHERDATAHFEYVLGRDSLHRDVLYQYAILERDRGRFARALELAHAQVRLKPEQVDSFVGLFDLYEYVIHQADAARLDTLLAARGGDIVAFYEAERQRLDGQLADAGIAFLRLLDSEIVPRSLVQLARARVYFARGEDEKAQACVEDAIAAIRGPRDAAFVFEDVKYIISEKELALYRSLKTPEQYRAFFQTFWLQRDPLPAMPVNARLSEHYRRLLKAEQDYAFYGYRLWHNDPDRRGDLDLPQAYYLNKEFNDKGLIYIRHGEPADRESYVGDDIGTGTQKGEVNAYWNPIERGASGNWVPNESWRYENPRMDFHFVIDDGASGNNWRLTPTITHFGILENLEHWGQPYAEMVAAARRVRGLQFEQYSDLSQAVTGAGDDAILVEEALAASDSAQGPAPVGRRMESGVLSMQSRYLRDFEQGEQRLVEESRAYVLEGLTTDRHTWDDAVEPIEMPYRLLAFRGEEGQTDLELHFALPIGYITETDASGAGLLPIEMGYALHRMDWTPVREHAEQKKVPASPDVTTALIDYFRITVPPDSYHVALHGQYEKTRQLGGHTTTYAAPDFSRPGLAMSDLLMADEIRPASSVSKFNRNGLYVSPNPLHRYSTRQSVFVYFEIYNLTYDGNDQTAFTVEYTLDATNGAERRGGLFRRGKDGPTLSLKTERSGAESSTVEVAEIDVGKVEPGTYTFSVTVTDDVSGAQVTRSQVIELYEYR